jgi:hypothetical protein
VLFMREHVPIWQPPAVSPERRREVCAARAVFIWSMAPIALKYIARGSTSRAVRMLGLMSDAFIVLWRLVQLPDVSDPETWLNRPVESDLRALLPQAAETIDRGYCLAAVRQLCAQTERMHGALAAMGVAVPVEMPEQVERLAGLAEAMLQTPR